jgi:hypothetical protein
MQIEGSRFDVDGRSQASFSHLATRLDAVAPFLTNFELQTNFHSDADHSRWLYYVTPGAGFQNFCMLRSLKIPYHCLGNFDVVVWPILHYGVYPRKKCVTYCYLHTNASMRCNVRSLWSGTVYD